MKKIYLSTVIALAMHSFANAQEIATINDIKVYNAAGKLVYAGNKTAINVLTDSVYIVVIEGESHKVVIR